MAIVEPDRVTRSSPVQFSLKQLLLATNVTFILIAGAPVEILALIGLLALVLLAGMTATALGFAPFDGWWGVPAVVLAVSVSAMLGMFVVRTLSVVLAP